MIYLYILVMAVTTYLIRALPLTLLKKPISNRFLKSFLHYVPTACLTALSLRVPTAAPTSASVR